MIDKYTGDEIVSPLDTLYAGQTPPLFRCRKPLVPKKQTETIRVPARGIMLDKATGFPMHTGLTQLGLTIHWAKVSGKHFRQGFRFAGEMCRQFALTVKRIAIHQMVTRWNDLLAFRRRVGPSACEIPLNCSPNDQANLPGAGEPESQHEPAAGSG